MIIESKEQMADLLVRGCLGNTVRIFRTEHELLDSGAPLTSVRCLGRPNLPHESGFPALQAFPLARSYETEFGCRTLVSEAPDDSRLLIQGELSMIENRFYFFHSFMKTSLRLALRKGIELKGLPVFWMLKGYLNSASFDDIRELMELYPNHVIELSIYDYCLGTRKGRNYVVWEVRGTY